MSTLTGQQIKDTYDGLLKLADSTNGITPNLQAVQDGLGNNTGSRIATNYFTAPNVYGCDFNLKPDFGGIGFGSGAGGGMAANTQNRVLFNFFYDAGVYDYSAVTYNLGTLTSTSDVVEMAFYTLQSIPGYGLAPHNLIMSGISFVSTGTTGVKTTTLPSTLSFSGGGGGWYCSVFYISNAGFTPSVRYTQPPVQVVNQSFWQFGWFLNQSGNQTTFGSRQASITLNTFYQLNLPIQSSYTELDIINNIGNQVSSQPGFALNVIR